jgi:hypothetical protein
LAFAGAALAAAPDSVIDPPVTLAGGRQPLGDLLASISAQSGLPLHPARIWRTNGPPTVIADLVGLEVSLEPGTTPLSQVLRRLRSAAGLRLTPDSLEGGCRVSNDAPRGGNGPSTAAGDYTVHLTRVTYFRCQSADFLTPSLPASSFLATRYWIEPASELARQALVDVDPQSKLIVDGQALAPEADRLAPRLSPLPFGVWPQGCLSFQPPAAAPRRLESLQSALAVLADAHECLFDFNPVSGQGEIQTDGDLDLTLVSVKPSEWPPPGAPAWPGTAPCGWWTVQLKLALPGAAGQQALTGNWRGWRQAKRAGQPVWRMAPERGGLPLALLPVVLLTTDQGRRRLELSSAEFPAKPDQRCCEIQLEYVGRAPTGAAPRLRVGTVDPGMRTKLVPFSFNNIDLPQTEGRP